MVVSLGAGGGGTVYLGTADGHVFASEDGASSWELRGRVGNRLDAVVTRLLVDPEDEKRVLAAVWFRDAAENGGVFRSSDGGRSWQPSGLQGEAVRALERAPSRRHDVVAGTRTGVFRSRDGAVSWQRISPEGDPELRNVDSIAIDLRDPDVVYAGTYHLPWRTKDGGKSWEPIITGIIDDSDIMSLRLDSANPDRVYMSACSGIYRSENQGGQWTKLQGIPYAARRTHTIVQDPANAKTFYAGTTEGGWVTDDSGETWKRTTPKSWVVNSLVVLTEGFAHPGRIVVGTEAGIEVSDNRGETFAPSNAGFKHVIVKQLAAGLEGSNEILALVQRNGWELLESTDQGKEWTPVSLTDAQGSKAALNADQIGEVLLSPWGWILRMADGHLWLREEKGTWWQWKPKMSTEAAKYSASSAKTTANTRAFARQIEPGRMAFGASFVLVASGEGVLRCEEAGSCRALKAFRSGTVVDLWTSKTGNEIAILQDGKLGMSLDGGVTASWRDVPVGRALWIRWSEKEEQGDGERKEILVLGTSAGLFLSGDRGTHWEAAKSGLPAGGMGAWLADPAFWLVSERSGGLYLSTTKGTSWARIDDDAERGRFAGFAKVGERDVLAGSESEGILKVTVHKK